MFDILNVRKGPDRAKCTMCTFTVPLMIFLKVALIVLLLSLTNTRELIPSHLYSSCRIPENCVLLGPNIHTFSAVTCVCFLARPSPNVLY